MVPMVNDAIDAERVVQAARFAPHGSRGFGLLYRDQLAEGVGAAIRAADEATLVIVQIETEAGTRSRGRHRGHDRGRRAVGGAVRPVDRDWGSPARSTTRACRAAEDRVLAACAAAGITAGVLVGSVDVARSMLARGFRMVALGSDIDLYGGALRAGLEALATRTTSG